MRDILFFLKKQNKTETKTLALGSQGLDLLVQMSLSCAVPVGVPQASTFIDFPKQETH